MDGKKTVYLPQDFKHVFLPRQKSYKGIKLNGVVRMDDGRIPVAYGYGRVSHRRQAETGESIAGQEERIKGFYEWKLKPDGLEWGGFYQDPRNVSAYDRPFMRRHAGKRLLAVMKPGDHLIIDKIDRLWRDLEDFAVTRRYFRDHGINVHCVNYMGAAFEWDSPAGNFFLSTFVAMSQMESDVTSHRIRRAKKRIRDQGFWTVEKKPPLGTKAISLSDGRKRLEWDQDWLAEVGVLQQISIDREDMSWEDIADWAEQELCRKAGKTWKKSAFYEPIRWNRTTVRVSVERKMVLDELFRQYPNVQPNDVNWGVLKEARLKQKRRNNRIRYGEFREIAAELANLAMLIPRDEVG